MRVLVTGGTGFIGSHSVAELVRAGHAVRLLVRDPERVQPALRPHGLATEDVEVRTGGVTDAPAVEAAVRDCDAVLHAASVYSFDTRDHRAMRAVNVAGTATVLDAAHRAGADPIVHVSSFGALVPTTDPVVTPDTPPARPRETYLATKAEADAIARRYQDDGAPVAITYPLATLGPHDPHLGDQIARLRNMLRGLMPIWPRGGFPVGDVRDVARLHAAVLRPGKGPRRYLAPGSYLTTREYVATVRRVTGRALPAVHLPAAPMLPLGLAVGLLQRVIPVHIPAEYGGIYVCATGKPVDTSDTDTLLDGQPYPFDQTVHDAIRWLWERGLVSRRMAGKAAGSADVAATAAEQAAEQSGSSRTAP